MVTSNAPARVPERQPEPTNTPRPNAQGKKPTRFVIKLGDGSEYSGILDSEGKTDMDLDGSGTITFPDLAKPS